MINIGWEGAIIINIYSDAHCATRNIFLANVNYIKRARSDKNLRRLGAGWLSLSFSLSLDGRHVIVKLFYGFAGRVDYKPAIWSHDVSSQYYHRGNLLWLHHHHHHKNLLWLHWRPVKVGCKSAGFLGPSNNSRTCGNCLVTFKWQIAYDYMMVIIW